MTSSRSDEALSVLSEVRRNRARLKRLEASRAEAMQQRRELFERGVAAGLKQAALADAGGVSPMAVTKALRSPK